MMSLHLLSRKLKHGMLGIEKANGKYFTMTSLWLSSRKLPHANAIIEIEKGNGYPSSKILR